MRLGVFGGTFDPVHHGHLLLAELTREQLHLDAVWFLPACTPPHKQSRVLTSAEQRVEMLQLAIGGHPSFAVCTLEIERGGLSYTVDTLEALHRKAPERELFLLLGADSLADLPTWHEPARICQLALPVIAPRPGSTTDLSELARIIPPSRIAQIERCLVRMPLVELSSREIRARVHGGLSIRYQTTRAVEKYIEQAGLYRADDAAVGRNVAS